MTSSHTPQRCSSTSSSWTQSCSKDRGQILMRASKRCAEWLYCRERCVIARDSNLPGCAFADKHRFSVFHHEQHWTFAPDPTVQPRRQGRPVCRSIAGHATLRKGMLSQCTSRSWLVNIDSNFRYATVTWHCCRSGTNCCATAARRALIFSASLSALGRAKPISGEDSRVGIHSIVLHTRACGFACVDAQPGSSRPRNEPHLPN